MFEIISLGVLALAAFLFAAFVVITVFVESQRAFAAGIAIVITGLVAWLVFDVTPPDLLSLTGVFLVLGYFGFGVAYGFFRWWRYLYQIANLYQEKKAEYLKQNRLTENALSDEERKMMVRTIKSEIIGYSKTLLPAPKISEHQSMLYTWMAYWPFSLAAMLCRDFFIESFRWLGRVWKWIYGKIAGTLQRMSDNMFAKFKSDL